jgi:hypothetical protein
MTLHKSFPWRSKTINRGGHSKRLRAKVTINQRTTEAVILPAWVNELKKQQKGSELVDEAH